MAKGMRSLDNTLERRTFILQKIPVSGVVIAHDHTMNISVDKVSRRGLVALGVVDGSVVVVEDKDRGISFQTTIRIHPSRAYIRIPKAFHTFYEHGEEITVIVTPLPITRRKKSKSEVDKP